MTLRDDILALDGYKCQNPNCLTVAAIEAGEEVIQGLVVHHIKYRSAGGKDLPEIMISLCFLDDHGVHHGYGRGDDRLCGREFMLQILDNRKKADPNNFRWEAVHAELTRKYGEVEK